MDGKSSIYGKINNSERNQVSDQRNMKKINIWCGKHVIHANIFICVIHYHHVRQDLYDNNCKMVGIEVV